MNWATMKCVSIFYFTKNRNIFFMIIRDRYCTSMTESYGEKCVIIVRVKTIHKTGSSRVARESVIHDGAQWKSYEKQ